MEVLPVSVMVIITVLSTWAKVIDNRNPRCSMPTEFTITHPNRSEGLETCRPCPICPPGQGLPKSCGSKVPNGTSTDCVPCEANRTYSTSNDSSTCSECDDCGLENVVQVCTPFQKRICGTSCPKGYYKDKLTDDCKKCFFCCDHVLEREKEEQCKVPNMPNHMRCERTPANENCKKLYEKAATTTKSPVETTPFDTTLTTTKEPSTMTSEHSSKSRSQQMTTNNNHGTLTEDKYLPARNDTSTPPSTSEKGYKAGMITLFVGLAIFIIGLTVCFTRRKKTEKKTKKKRCRQRNPSPHKNTIKLTVIPQEQDLKNLPDAVEKAIKRLDCRSRGISNWYNVGRKFNIPDEDLEQLELEYERKEGSPMKSLIDILHAKYSTKLRGLVMVLLELDRKNIVDEICSFYISKQRLATIQTNSTSSVESAYSWV